MDVVTICKLDSWVETHLARFVYFAKKSMPKAKLHLLVPITMQDTAKARADFMKVASPIFNQIVFVPETLVQGRLLYFDLLRAEATELLGLSECLYVDVDTDILEDLSDIPSTSAADVIVVPNSTIVADVTEDLRNYGMNDLQIEEGLFYFRRSFRAELEHVVAEGKINMHGIGPGLSAWAVLLPRVKHHVLPLTYHVTVWRPELFDVARSIHFTGMLAKQWRLHTGYRRVAGERRMFISSYPCGTPGVNLQRGAT